jgi:UDP-glucose 4-epimerase
VTGGAGYVGSHAAKLLASAGHEIWVYDNLVFGHRAAVAPGRLIEGDLLDRGKVEAVLREQPIDAVMHFAAFAYVGESVTDPAKYYHNNVVGTLKALAQDHLDKRLLRCDVTLKIHLCHGSSP